MYALEELAWAIMQERQVRPLRSPERSQRHAFVPLRARVARALVQAGVCLDRSAGDALCQRAHGL